MVASTPHADDTTPLLFTGGGGAAGGGKKQSQQQQKTNMSAKMMMMTDDVAAGAGAATMKRGWLVSSALFVFAVGCIAMMGMASGGGVGGVGGGSVLSSSLGQAQAEEVPVTPTTTANPVVWTESATAADDLAAVVDPAADVAAAGATAGAAGAAAVADGPAAAVTDPAAAADGPAAAVTDPAAAAVDPAAAAAMESHVDVPVEEEEEVEEGKSTADPADAPAPAPAPEQEEQETTADAPAPAPSVDDDEIARVGTMDPAAVPVDPTAAAINADTAAVVKHERHAKPVHDDPAASVSVDPAAAVSVDPAAAALENPEAFPVEDDRAADVAAEADSAAEADAALAVDAAEANPVVEDAAAAAVTAPDARACNFKDLSTGLKMTEQNGPCGMIRDAVTQPLCPEAPEFHNFACGSKEYENFLQHNTYMTPGCTLNVPAEAPSDGPFAPGEEVLMVGSSWIMQLSNAFMVGAVVFTSFGCLSISSRQETCIETCAFSSSVDHTQPDPTRPDPTRPRGAASSSLLYTRIPTGIVKTRETSSSDFGFSSKECSFAPKVKKHPFSISS